MTTRRRLGRILTACAALTGLVLTSGAAAAAQPTTDDTPAFGPNVTVFDPSTPVSEIQATLDATYAQQVTNEMGTQRFHPSEVCPESADQRVQSLLHPDRLCHGRSGHLGARRVVRCADQS